MRKPEEEVRMMSSPNLWPKWPVLPVKKLNGQLPVGVMFEHPDTTWDKPIVNPVVYLVNMFAFDYTKLHEYEKMEYATLQDVVDDGWVVD